MLMRFAATVGSFTMLSRILGFVRDIMIASFLGASSTGDAFFIAFKFPNLFRRLFSEGAFSLAFVPLFAEKLESDGRRAARFFAEDLFPDSKSPPPDQLKFKKILGFEHSGLNIKPRHRQV